MVYKNIQVSIDVIHCANCGLNIENTPNKLNGVNNVNLNSNKAQIKYNPEKIHLKDIDQTIESIGFEYKKRRSHD